MIPDYVKRKVDRSLTLPEIFERVMKYDGDFNDKCELLSLYNNKAMQFYADSLINRDWTKKKITDDYVVTKDPIGFATNINNCTQRLDLAYSSEDQSIIDKQLSIVLSSVSKEEVDLLLNLFKGKSYGGVDRRMIKKAFPSIVYNKTEI